MGPTERGSAHCFWTQEQKRSSRWPRIASMAGTLEGLASSNAVHAPPKLLGSVRFPTFWKETVAGYASRLTRVAQYINSKYNVKNLNRELPRRLRELVAAEGDRLKYSFTVFCA